MAGNVSIPEVECFVGKPDLRKRYGLDPATLLRRVRAGEFPAPVYVFGRARWRLAEIQAWELKNVGATPPGKFRNLRNQGDK